MSSDKPRSNIIALQVEVRVEQNAGSWSATIALLGIKVYAASEQEANERASLAISMWLNATAEVSLVKLTSRLEEASIPYTVSSAEENRRETGRA